jgi:hypothetical protein
MKKVKFLLCFLAVSFLLTMEAAQAQGTISGKVVESSTKRVIPGVYVEIINTSFSTLSNEKGEFKIAEIPAGNYSIKFSTAGFKPVIKTDVIVRPKRISYLNTEMQMQIMHLKEVVDVSGSYFHEDEKVPHSVHNLSAEEVRRATGTAGDVSRALTVLPGIGKSFSDQYNDLIVRGGNPLENAFYIDNIEVPNINHLPSLGSTGGMVSALNVDLIQNVDFFTGGFSSIYGDRLSSVTDITFREGNRKEFDAQINFSLLDAGLVLEGPIAGGKGSWLISGKSSYFELVKNLGLLDINASVSTRDMQAKLTFDINPKHNLTLLYCLGDGNYNFFDGNYFGNDQVYTHNTVGMNWRSRWSDKFFSRTSLSYASLDRNDGENYHYNNQIWSWSINNFDRSVSFRNVNFLFLGPKNKIEFGAQVKHEMVDIDYTTDPYTDYNGNLVPAIDTAYEYSSTKPSLFFTYIWNPFNSLTASIGFRGDYSSAQERFHLSPRLSLSFQITDNFSINGGYGIFYQTIPLNYLAYKPGFKDLHDMKAIHYILGFEYFPGSGTKIVLEFYQKKYNNLPINPNYPLNLVLDRSAFDKYYLPDDLVDTGTAFSRGVELLIQKKLLNKFYGIISATLFKCRYKDLLGVERPRTYDNRYMLNLSAGYKPNRKWEFSVKWIFRGGIPYTPIDIESSTAANQWILEQNMFLKERLPDYNSLNFRIDRRFYFKKANIIIYLDIWNILNRKNVGYYSWNYNRIEMETENQSPILPILGIEFEF